MNNMSCSINRLHIGENGDLMIDHVVPSDEGKYQCVAHNMAATRESPIVSLSVHGKHRLRHVYLLIYLFLISAIRSRYSHVHLHHLS